MGKKGGAVLGKNLARTQQKSKKVIRGEKQEGFLHTTDLQDGYDWGRLNLQSVTEEDSFQDFLNTAELAGREFDAEKWNIKLMDAKTRQVYVDTNNGGELRELTEEERNLPIPRRPEWAGLSAEELREAENKGFLEWRRQLASLQEETDCVVTPYEKNLEFWRQLWRVIERSDLIVQIVDCRHPLMFRSPDLEKYVKEVSPIKQNLLLVNKSDFLSEEQRKAWAEYFKSENIKFAFFSAITEDADSIIDELNSVSDNEEAEVNNDSENEVEDDDSVKSSESEIDSSIQVLSSTQLLALFRSYKRHECENITVGCIGYPNVGKSSTINKLLACKKVRVSETPGKTKHFQTLELTEDITLCDCPGLVMPSIANSKAGMVLQGILPIDQLRDHVPAITLLLSHVPSHVFESKYGLVLPRVEGENSSLSSEKLLTAYGTLRGFMTAGGRPDQSRAARIILKDYVGGKLLFCEAPPGQKQDAFHQFPVELRRIWKDDSHKIEEARRLQQQLNKTKQEEIDSNFFSNLSLGAHVKGHKKIEGRLSDKNKKKKKLRNIYSDLDPKRHGHE